MQRCRGARRRCPALGCFAKQVKVSMSKEIIIAIISGVVGLAGGVIAWIQAARTSHLKADADATLERIRSETSLTLENLKADQERRKRAFEAAVEESKPVEAALAQAWHDIQSIKDVISK